MRTIRFAALGAVLIPLLLALGACTPGSPTSDSAAPAATPGGLPPLARKDKYRVGFSQTESNNPWRLAETASMQTEASKRGWDLIFTDAGGSTAQQLTDIDSLIAQHVDAIFLTPREEKPLAAAVLRAKAAGIPVILIDRRVDPALAQAGRDYICFIGSDFVQEGQRVAEWLIRKTGGQARILELEGSAGASPAQDRKQGFDAAIKGQPGMRILASESGDFARDKGRAVTQALLAAHPDATVIYAHNDEMAIGALSALKAAGKQPGKDVLVVSVDGERDALQAILDGQLGATCECNPRFGPKAFETLAQYAAGTPIPPQILNPDQFFDATNAKDSIAGSY